MPTKKNESLSINKIKKEERQHKRIIQKLEYEVLEERKKLQGS